MFETYQKQKNSSGEPTAPATFPQLEAGERPAPTAVLSAPKRAALLACLYGGGTLHKSRGVWTAQPARAFDKRIYGMTIADLARDGMLTLTVTRKSASGRLTPRGLWFARTLAAEKCPDDQAEALR